MNDDETERALRDSLRMPALSAEAMQRIRRATEAEWRATLMQRPARRWAPAIAAALVVAVTLGAVGMVLKPWPGPGEPIGQLARAEAPGMVLDRDWFRPDVVVSVGADLRVGERFDARGASLVSLPAGGNLRIAPASKLDVIGRNSIRLAAGELYVDIPRGSETEDFTVITNSGEFHHVGTQFALAVIDGGTRLRVREGRVEWRAGEGQSTVGAGTEIFIDRDRNVTRRDIEPAGADWRWTEALAPDIDIEDQPLAEFLDWVSRETGRTLVVADEQTGTQIRNIRTHGDVRGLTPMQALTAVMSSTTLHFDVSADAIRVSLAGETPRPPG
jgi:ferric-dicitrate binding protein FerR (iron transport regulator)